jgi:RimJ/RimL family protein N-acetyltransferase
MQYSVRRVEITDLPQILEIYANAREFMKKNGNHTQWGGGYPSRGMLEDDINRGNLYAVTRDTEIYGVFCFVLGDDPTYAVMEDGCWRSDTPYGTIHRIASRGSGVFAAALNHCRSRIGHIRIDTHADNYPMQHLVTKHGFSRRGIIHVADGTPRIAYDLI